MAKKICRKCGGEIDLEKDKYVILGTRQGKEVLDDSYFHYDHFVEWFNEKLEAKAETIVKNDVAVEDMAKGILDGVLNELGGFGIGTTQNQPTQNQPTQNSEDLDLPDLESMQAMVKGLTEGSDAGLGLDIHKEANEMVDGIKKMATGLTGLLGKKKNGEQKEETRAKAS